MRGAVSPTSPDPSLHQRILADIEGRILSGAWAPGTRIPFEVDLARDYGCSRMTVNKVLTQLAKNGLIERRRRSGSYVRRPVSQAAVLEIRDVASEVAGLGREYGYRLLSRAVRRATTDERGRLGLGAGGRVVVVTALHLADGAPFCLEERAISLGAVPEAAEATFAEEAPGLWLLRRVPWSSAEHVVRAVEADAGTAGLLGLAEGRACLVIERRTAFAGAYVTDVRLTYPGHLHAVEATFTPTQAAPGP